MNNHGALTEFLNDLGRRVDGDLRTDSYSKMLYSTDASIYQVMPHGVLIPKTADDVQAAVELSHGHRIPIVPRTGGSSLAGQVVNEALIIDMSRHLDQVIELNVEERWVRVQPGIVLDELNLYLRPYNLQFGPDPASSNRACMGGIVANNSTGSHSIAYGMTADHVLGMNVILNDGSRAVFGPLDEPALRQRRQRSGLEGAIYQQIDDLISTPTNQEIIRAGTPRHWRRCGGYNLDRFVDEGEAFHYPQDQRFNLAKLVSGSEGTLAVMTALKLNLVPVPKMTALAVVHFDQLVTALEAVPIILEVEPTVVELLDNLGLTLCREVPQYARLLDRFVEGRPNCVLITEFYGESEAELQAKVARLKGHLERQRVGATAVTTAFNKALQQDVWTVRKVALGFLMSIKGDYKPIPFIEDAAVPVEHLAEYVMKIERFCNDIGTDVAYYAHVSAGCLHIRPLINTKKAEEVAKLTSIIDFSVELLHGYGGSLSSEHGDGRVRSWANERFFGPDLYGLYREVKGIFDPENLLNPGNIVNAPAVGEHLRYGESYQVIHLNTVIDFSHEQGFNRAVEMCNGAGVCRKKITGTMCPPFMVTREEEHSTRGRANALRAAMSGRLPAEELTSQRMYDVMDLCIECKACQAECPSSVDMAKIKTAFLAQYHEANGVSLRTRLFANIAKLSRFSSGRLSPIVNWSLGNGLVRGAMEKVVGIGRKRRLPRFARRSFVSWFKGRKKGVTFGIGRKVILFNDTYNTYNSPHIAIAATEVLEAAGFEVVLSEHGCCGRPMISKGLVKDAKQAAEQTVNKLAVLVRANAVDGRIPIIALEPSCLSALQDDYGYLLPNNENARLVEENSLSFEEFIAETAEKGDLELKFTEATGQILLHGHCHQKALIGTEPSRKALTLPANYQLDEVDSGCCGMAGSFGYEAEHYDLSIQMAERRLLPAVREEEAGTLIVAAGVSCRQQIEHGSGKRPLHPAEVLRMAILNLDCD